MESIIGKMIVYLKKKLYMNTFYFKSILLFLAIALFYNDVDAQNAEQGGRYDDYIYNPDIKTVKLFRPEFDFSQPMIELNSTQKLLLTFDDLSGDYKQYKYSIELCDAWWQPLNLNQADYISGFYDDDIVEYKYSGSTRIPYVHYRLEFPNDNMKPKKSGNYILKVWSEDSGSKVIAFTRRFFVMNNLVSINASITAGTLIDTRWYKQEVDFFIDRQSLNIVNPNTNLKVIVMQNSRWRNAIFGLQPKLIKGNIFEYDYDGENSFDGGNEFRNFDIKSMKYQTAEIDGIRLVDSEYHVFLRPDVKRNFLRYSHRSDINGRYYIKSDDHRDSETESEYVYVYFTLLYDAPRTDGDVYLSGELTGRQLSEDYKMKYNFDRKAYELTVLLKQGFYDYEYVFLPQGNVIEDFSEIEGRHYTTENEYSVWVYYRFPGELHDDLIGLKFINSRN
jgi:hypothetical protein